MFIVRKISTNEGWRGGYRWRHGQKWVPIEQATIFRTKTAAMLSSGIWPQLIGPPKKGHKYYLGNNLQLRNNTEIIPITIGIPR